MIIKKVYDEEAKVQKVWYDSSMIYYSEMHEDANYNVGDLYITFNTGACYKYNKVKFEDYMVFIGGGSDASQGKTLNKVIKGKYEFERVDDSNKDELARELERIIAQEKSSLMDAKNTVFVYGEPATNEDEFSFYYAPILFNESNISETKFIMPDDKVGRMAQDYLLSALNVNPDRITVYHMGEKPENINPAITSVVGGFEDERAMNDAMINASSRDIVYVHDTSAITTSTINILTRYKI